MLIAAPLFLDILCPYFFFSAVNRFAAIPGTHASLHWTLCRTRGSHSLLMSIDWATAFASLYYLLSRYRPGAFVVWILVVSHWILDWVTHRPGPVALPGRAEGWSRFVELGCRNDRGGAFPARSWSLALRACDSRSDRIGLYPLIVYLGLLLWFYLGGRSDGGDVDVRAIAWAGVVGMFLLLPWAWWFDRHRVSK